MNQTIPPSTRADVQNDLSDATLSVYLYVGKESDEAWDNAKAVAALVSKHHNYLVVDRVSVPECGADAALVGAVFGFAGKFHRFLSQAEADNFDTLLDAVTAARKL